MANTTLNLPCARFVKRVTNGALGSKYSYIAMMADNAKALETAQWRKASTPLNEVSMPVNKVSQTDAEYDESGAMVSPPSFKAFTDDRFDAFQQGGDARKENATMCGYAGCVAYRFTIPAAASSVPLSSVDLEIQRDRYCRAGVRVALVLSDEAQPSDDWAVIRGENGGAIVSPSTASDAQGVASWGFLGQSGIGNLVGGRAADGVLTFNASGTGGFPALAETGNAYLWVYLTLEDYKSYWTMYNATDPRYYSIEGSAMLVASRCAFTFAGSVAEDQTSWISTFQGCTGYAAGESTTGTTTDAILAAYGNIMQATCHSGLSITSCGEDVMPSLAHLERYGIKPFLSYTPSGAPSDMAAAMVPLDDCDVIGGIRDFGVIDGDNKTHNQNLIRALKCEVYNKLDSNSRQRFAQADGKLRAPTFAHFAYIPFVVPQGRSEYTRLKLSRSGGTLVAHTSGFDCDLLLWKCVSDSLFGPWRDSAISALASNVEFFMGRSGSIAGSVNGDGTLTAGVQVKAEASLLQRVDMDAVTGSYLEIDLASPVSPGEVIVIVPTLKRATVTLTWDALLTISWNATPNNCYFA